MIILAVDPGKRRVGLAVCDANQTIASPLRVERVRSSGAAVAVVLAAVAETGAGRVVLGHPRNMNGRPGPEARAAEAFAETLRGEGIDVVLWDERLTSAEAERCLRNANLSRKKRVQHLDAVAAQRMLESYLSATSRESS